MPYNAHVNLFTWLFPKNKPSAALVGGGGKTSVLRQAAQINAARSSLLLMSTSTKLKRPTPLPDTSLYQGSALPEHLWKRPSTMNNILWVAGLTEDGRKWTAPPLQEIEKAVSRCGEREGEFVLVEADGSAGRPIKAPGRGEPVLPANIHTVVALIGLSGLGYPAGDSIVHRMEHYEKITGCRAGEPVSAEAILNLLSHPEGIFRNTGTMARRLVLLNQFDTIGKENSEHSRESRRREMDSLFKGMAGLFPKIDSAAFACLSDSPEVKIIDVI